MQQLCTAAIQRMQMEGKGKRRKGEEKNKRSKRLPSSMQNIPCDQRIETLKQFFLHSLLGPLSSVRLSLVPSIQLGIVYRLQKKKEKERKRKKEKERKRRKNKKQEAERHKEIGEKVTLVLLNNNKETDYRKVVRRVGE